MVVIVKLKIMSLDLKVRAGFETMVIFT